MTKHEALRRYFGYDTFREGQETLIDSILAGRDAVGVMPTGAGKSLCFQLPALLQEGITLVVSPLISLMRDQVMTLCGAGVKAAYLNSSLTPAQLRKAMQNLAQGMYKIVYIAPERLLLPDFLQALAPLRVSLLAVDEAHCISQWGKDFRPEYTDIPAFAARLPQRPVLAAFTATATHQVRQDIIARLALTDYTQFTTSFDRPNLFFAVQQPRNKKAALLALAEKHRGESGIVYCSTRKAADEVTALLLANGFSAACYHAGLGTEPRLAAQEAFLYDRVDIIVATNAFGMGIDKPGVRYVVHYNMPLDLESYYQEAGRAGRDGLAAECVLLYGKQDVMTGRFLLERGSEQNEATDPAQRAQLLQTGLDRLRLMTFYATSTRCLRQAILRYFDESAPADCGNCSVCLGLPRAAAQDEERFAAHGGSKPRTRSKQPACDPADAPLFEALRALRRELATRRGVPAYVVCTDATLLDMCAKRPQTPDDLRAVQGIGTQKLNDYGDAFLKLLHAHSTPQAADSAGQ